MAPKTASLFLVAAGVLAGCGDDAAKAPPGSAPAATAAPPAAAAAPGPRFEEIAEKAGLRFRMDFLRPEQGENFKINLYDHGCGVAIADFDGDGRDDVYLLNQLGPNALFRNNGDGTFTDVTKQAGVGLDGLISVGAAFADCDGDGDLDLFVTTTRGGNVYFENMGGGKFRDATKEAGLTLVTESWSPTFFDADGDGDLDLLVTNTAHWTKDEYDEQLRYYRGKVTLADLIASEKEQNNLYLNDGKGHFTDATKESGLGGKGWGGDAAVFDYDGDGALDVFVCNMFGASTLFRNDGKGHFTDVTRAVLGKTSWGAVGARAFDYDGDGLLDLFVVDMHSDMWTPFKFDPALVEPSKKYRTFFERAIALGTVPPGSDADLEAQAQIRRDEVVFGNTLFRNLGGGKFEEVSARAGVETFWPWGIAEGDFDGDGFQDAYIPTGMGYPFFYWPSSLLRNRGDGTFQDCARTAGTEPPPGGPNLEFGIAGRPAPRSSRSAAVGDLDGDGRLDLVVNNFNDRAFYFHNVSAPGHWCELALVATRGEREGIGAVARLTAGGRTMVRQVQAAGGYLAQSSNRLHFGLGAATSIDRVEIRWPGGDTQTVEHPAVNALTTITEPPR